MLGLAQCSNMFKVTQKITKLPTFISRASTYAKVCNRQYTLSLWQLRKTPAKPLSYIYWGDATRRGLCTTSCLRTDDDDGIRKPRNLRYLKLMDFEELIWPSVFKSMKNFFMSIIIRGYFDSQFTVQGFLTGAEQAVGKVSTLISTGQFDALENLVTREATREIQRNYQDLEAEQRQFIRVDPADIFLRFIYEIGIIFDDNTNKRYVEITTVVQGIHGIGVHVDNGGEMSDMMSKPNQLYICNYRFIREYTKGVEDDWTINKLNHFLPSEYVQRKGMFDR